MRKGFTLIELLIVIGVLGILATTTVLVLDPSEILKRSRDVQRLNDLRNLRNAIDLYLVRTPNPTLNGAVCMQGGTSVTHGWRASTPENTTLGPQLVLPAQLQTFEIPDTAIVSASVSETDVFKIDGNGWVSVPLNQITGINPPISKLPIDPINNVDNDLFGLFFPGTPAGHYYTYQCYRLTYEINTNMESIKYSKNGDKDVESTDGGKSACFGIGSASVRCDTTLPNDIYEIGNDPGLDL